MSELEGHVDIGLLFESVRLKRQLDTKSRSHLEECDFCRGQASWMQAATAMGSQKTEDDPPEELVAQVRRLGRKSAFQPFLNLIVASLKFDSFNGLVPVGIRRTQDSSRQLTYEAGNIQVTIQLKKSETRIKLTGQVLRNDDVPVTDSAARVDVVMNGEHLASMELTSWGEFIFPELPMADCDLQICLADRVLRISKLPVMDAGRPSSVRRT